MPSIHGLEKLLDFPGVGLDILQQGIFSQPLKSSATSANFGTLPLEGFRVGVSFPGFLACALRAKGFKWVSSAFGGSGSRGSQEWLPTIEMAETCRDSDDSEMEVSFTGLIIVTIIIVTIIIIAIIIVTIIIVTDSRPEATWETAPRSLRKAEFGRRGAGRAEERFQQKLGRKSQDGVQSQRAYFDLFS